MDRGKGRREETVSSFEFNKPKEEKRKAMNFSAAAFNPDKFSPFNIYSTSYKTVDEHPIGVDVLVPRDLKLGTEKHPLMVRFHGGYLVKENPFFPFFVFVAAAAALKSNPHYHHINCQIKIQGLFPSPVS